MFSKKIRDLMIEQDISLQKLADTSGVPFETLRNIYYQKVKDPKVSTAFQLAQALGVTVEYLLGENKYLECEQEEEELIKNYRECGNHGRAVIRIVARFESKAAQNERMNIHKMKHRIPCLVPVGKVSDGIYYNSCNVENEYTMIK